ncbi:unnamed protein product [Vitrella brassicaformis CCMP3155]|uniref:Uncharacterized protein n=1 Tax=Vitrella brassicaformis (strain CCMP3155) TaxID=1169540 RepID=A0A0G4EE41_VITBC|nr:unnamed protein product [Vitrella brassicaformis CCMP3155]|eukprot:CEL93628.1 unnamed protein product [Vitrella brassicaformis CCMP3155]
MDVSRINSDCVIIESLSTVKKRARKTAPRRPSYGYCTSSEDEDTNKGRGRPTSHQQDQPGYGYCTSSEDEDAAKKRKRRPTSNHKATSKAAGSADGVVSGREKRPAREDMDEAEIDQVATEVEAAMEQPAQKGPPVCVSMSIRSQ